MNDVRPSPDRGRSTTSYGRVDALHEALERATLKAQSRPTFDTLTGGDIPRSGDAPRSERLSEGHGRPSLIGIPATAALSGTHQYLELAKSFRGKRDLFALTVPGFVGTERLPANIEVAVRTEANVVQECMSGSPPSVLVGMSSGGTLAYGVAGYLESIGTPVAAVVLIDAYSFRSEVSQANVTYGLLRRMFEEHELRRYLTDTRLTAMAWYAKLFTDWQLTEIAAPTLLVCPENPMWGMSTDEEWRAEWPFSHDSIEVPGDHWTMTMEDSPSTAKAIEEWISSAVRL